ncbi:MAG: hypothetical protein Q7T20_09250 [Saprospiraceae bacterium]|nr:hypothetical protein [Saprospiraceae bacterium]
MRSAFLIATVSALLFPFMLNAQTSKKLDIEISSDVLKTAEWAAFKYMENIELAQKGDQKGLKELFEFSGTVDGVEALQHATTCIELIQYATDEKFGAVVSILKPKLKSVLLDRFQLAQARTKKEELRKPFQEWAPLTWKALNGEKVVCNSCMSQGALTKPAGKKPTPATLEVTEPVIATEKQ